VDRAEITRLGEGLTDTEVISTEAIDRTAAAVSAMAGETRDLHARAVAAVGTAWMRLARNRDEVARGIEATSGIQIETISGDEESRLAYLAARAGLGSVDGPIVVVDTGGGSTQFTFGDGGDVVERFSVEVGAVRYTERYGLANAVSVDVLNQALDAIAADLDRLDGSPAPAVLVGMGGAITNITAVCLGLASYDPGRVQGSVLHRDEIDRQIELYRTRDIDARRAIIGLQPRRADVILAGACIVRTVMDKLEQSSLTVSDRGLRHGVLVDRFATAPD
jgi:exopolyphosphatase/guanosine-5'-triphosphate,3'-diphosphate pyrophosphatase